MDALERKTLAQIANKCLLLNHMCKNCVGECEFEGTSTFLGKWISEKSLKKKVIELYRTYRSSDHWYYGCVALAVLLDVNCYVEPRNIPYRLVDVDEFARRLNELKK